MIPPNLVNLRLASLLVLTGHCWPRFLRDSGQRSTPTAPLVNRNSGQTPLGRNAAIFFPGQTIMVSGRGSSGRVHPKSLKEEAEWPRNRRRVLNNRLRQNSSTPQRRSTHMNPLGAPLPRRPESFGRAIVSAALAQAAKNAASGKQSAITATVNVAPIEREGATFDVPGGSAETGKVPPPPPAVTLTICFGNDCYTVSI